MNITSTQLAQYILTHGTTWWIWPLMLSIMSLIAFIGLTVKVEAHVKGKAKLAWFFAPYFPKRMYVIGKNVYYDDDIEVIKGEDGYHLMSTKGEHYTAKYDPDSVAVIRNSIGARAPEGVDSPFSLAWRWIVAASIMLYGAVMGFLAAYYDNRLNMVRVAEFFGYQIPENVTTLIVQDQAHAVAFSALIASIVFAWWLANLYRITVRSIKVMRFVPISVATNVTEIIPSIEPDSPSSIFKVLGDLVRNGIRLELGKGIRKILEELAKKTKLDKAAIVELLNRAEMAEVWRMQLGNRYEEYQDVKEAAIAECQLKSKELTPKLWANFAKIVALTLVGGLLVGLVVGYGVGAVWGAPSVQHANTTTTTATPMPPYYPPAQPQPPAGGNGTITPAQPPPPPISITPASGGGKP